MTLQTKRGRTRVLVVYGTRPELIKLAPVIFALRDRPQVFQVVVCNTAQHREMVDQVQEIFGIAPDFDLDLMRPDQRLNELSARAFSELDPVLRRVEPDWVLVQGDTTTVMATTVASFHLGVRIGHVEAGLRTGDLSSPFPEEANRAISDLLSDLLFSPTPRSRDLLLAEGRDPSRVLLTGNTVVDAVNWVAKEIPEELGFNEVLITLHRRENFGQPQRRILAAISRLAKIFPEITWIYPVHPNPRAQQPAYEVLGDVENVKLCAPLSYDQLVRHMKRARLILTDSGGIQEEAPTFGVPVLVAREKTERPEGVEIGAALLVGTNTGTITDLASDLLKDKEAHRQMARAGNPYGDGKAAQRIADILEGRPTTEFTPPSQDRIMKA